MFFGDYNYKIKKINIYFKVYKGLLVFDYCFENNVIVIGGMDYLIRVWNLYVNSKFVVVLNGYCKLVIYIVVNFL